ncbi:hypothetical protein [Kineococcus sp. NPDC059986]|uniref:hypothetical protein n=1 Tax=Kineococcus sp. NPDC059986 TaxID=3155538 RepID=UPI00344D835F
MTTAAEESEDPAPTNADQQLKRDVAKAAHEPVAWVCRAHAVSNPLRRRQSSVGLALSRTHVIVVTIDDPSTPFPAVVHERYVVAQVRAIGRRFLRAVDERGRVHWFRLGPQEPSARAFLTRPRTFRVA